MSKKNKINRRFDTHVLYRANGWVICPNALSKRKIRKIVSEMMPNEKVPSDSDIETIIIRYCPKVKINGIIKGAYVQTSKKGRGSFPCKIFEHKYKKTRILLENSIN